MAVNIGLVSILESGTIGEAIVDKGRGVVPACCFGKLGVSPGKAIPDGTKGTVSVN